VAKETGFLIPIIVVILVPRLRLGTRIKEAEPPLFENSPEERRKRRQSR
jgi:hypothetical protein